MSRSAVYKTSFKDKECLISALKHLYGNSCVSESKEYEITLNAQELNLYSPTGFNKQGDIYQLSYDSMDRRTLKRLFPQKKNGTPINELAQAYSRAKVISALGLLRGSIVKDEMDGDNMQIVIRTVSY